MDIPVSAFQTPQPSVVASSLLTKATKKKLSRASLGGSRGEPGCTPQN